MRAVELEGEHEISWMRTDDGALVRCLCGWSGGSLSEAAAHLRENITIRDFNIPLRRVKGL